MSRIAFTFPPKVMSLGLIFLWVANIAAGSEDPLSQDSLLERNVVAFLGEYCLHCHSDADAAGNIRLDQIQIDGATDNDWENWERVIRQVQRGHMPPAEEAQPTPEDRQKVIESLHTALIDALAQEGMTPRRGTARRLTNFEYENTLRDLLGIDLKLTDRLPEDPLRPYHFSNQADQLLIGPEQLDRYLECARLAMNAAIVDPGTPEVHRTQVQFEPRNDPLESLDVDEIGVYGSRRGTAGNGISIRSWPQYGTYRIRIQAAAILPPGVEQVPLRLVLGTSLRHDSGTGTYTPVGTVLLNNSVDDLQEFVFEGRIENAPFEAARSTAKGEQPARMMLYAQNLYDNGELNDHRKSAFDTSWDLAAPRIVLRSIDFESPITDVWPPTSHSQILFESPLRESNPDLYVRHVLQRFMDRAFRRPASDEEVARFSQIFALLEPDFETLEGAIRETLAMVLVSPQFLYHASPDDHHSHPPFELASRLSYFLWGSMPDSTLFDLAANGQLTDPKVIREQVQRLLSDPRAEDFFDQFTTQWLSLAKMKTVNINEALFPRFLYWVHVGERKGQEVLFRPTIRDYMHQETVGYVGHLIRENLTVDHLVDSDFAYLNEPLASHYGVEGVLGIEFRPVPIRPEHRLGGLLTQGSVLVGNSTGSAPHPIYRAVWLREAILGDEVPPPPAEVPALSDSAGESAETAVTIKDLLRLHRQSESCHSCHARLDPWGIPFEHYNATGKFQPIVPAAGTRVRGFNRSLDQNLEGYQAYLRSVATVEIEADTTLPSGSTIDGMQELKTHLLQTQKTQITENFVRKLVAYGLGRQLDFRDRPEIHDLVSEAESSNYGIQEMIIAICQSELFRGTTPNKD